MSKLTGNDLFGSTSKKPYQVDDCPQCSGKETLAIWLEAQHTESILEMGYECSACGFWSTDSMGGIDERTIAAWRTLQENQRP